MPSVTDISESTKALCDELTKAGLWVIPYARPPLSKDLFTIALDPSNALRVWKGVAEVTVIPARETKVRQAVLSVNEKGRTVKKSHRLTDYQLWLKTKTLEDARNNCSHWFIKRHLGVQLPPGAEYSIESFTRVDRPGQQSLSSVDYGTLVLVGKIKGTRQNFLVGRDEKSQFISALPRAAKSVFDAYEALRPAGVSRIALRQGEWFFVPATAAEKAAIKRIIESRGSEGIYKDTTSSDGYNASRIERKEVGELESGSSHHAPCLVKVNNRNYAVGLVYDTRPNRHGQLILKDWHRVVRNREVVNSTIGQRGTARWD